MLAKESLLWGLKRLESEVLWDKGSLLSQVKVVTYYFKYEEDVCSVGFSFCSVFIYFSVFEI